MKTYLKQFPFNKSFNEKNNKCIYVGEDVRNGKELFQKIFKKYSDKGFIDTQFLSLLFAV